MGGNSETGPLEGLANIGIFYNTGIGKKISKSLIRPVDKALGLAPPDMSGVDAMYMQQAKDAEENIKKIQASSAALRRKPIGGLRSGGGQTAQSLPTLSSVRQSQPASGSAPSIFEE